MTLISKSLGPEFAGDEEAVVRGVVGDAVEHGFGVERSALGQQAGEVDPAEDLAGRG